MKKNIIWLIVAAVLLAAMIAAMVALNNAPDGTVAESPSSAAETIYVTGGASAPLPASIEITNETGSYEVVNLAPSSEPGDKSGELTIKGFENLSLDSYGLSGIATNASALVAKRVVSETPSQDELAAYGLDKPRATVKAYYKSGGIDTLLFGADAPGGEGVYVRQQGHGAASVYLVTSTIADYFLKSRLDYVDTTVTAADPDYKGFDKAVISGSNYPEPIVIIRTPETEITAAGITLHSHTITSPINIGLHSSVGMEAIYSSYGLTASKVVDVGSGTETLAKYGLDNPAAVIEITGVSEELTFTLRVSATGEDGNVFLVKDGSPVIYQLPASTLTWLPLGLFDLMDKMVIVPSINNVSRVTLTTPDKTYIFGLTGVDDDLAVTLNGEKFPDAKDESGTAVDSTRNFRQLYQTMISAKYTDETDLAPAAGENPIVEIEYVYKTEIGRSPDVLRFYSGPARKTIMVYNGGTPYLGSSVYLDALIADAAKASAGQAVKAYI